MRLRILALLGVRPALRLNEGAGELASRVVFSRYESATGLRLVDTLLQVGSELEPVTDGLEDGADRARYGDALARAVVESALRSPVPLANRVHGHSNANGASRNGTNGQVNGAARGGDAEREPAKTG